MQHKQDIILTANFRFCIQISKNATYCFIIQTIGTFLNDIAIYTYTEEVPLRAIFQKIKDKENGGEAISHKSSKKELESYFSEILPDYDEDRVYVSDIKKVIRWYNLLQENNLLDDLEEELASQEEE